jgi:hypothetical protein
VKDRRLHHPRERIGTRLRVADGSIAWVYREARVDDGRAADPAVLVVSFVLRHSEESLLARTADALHLSYAADLVMFGPAYLLGESLLVSGRLQQAGYLAELAAQSRAGTGCGSPDHGRSAVVGVIDAVRG